MSNQAAKKHPDQASLISRWIEDPFRSIYAGIVAQAATLAVLFAGLFGLSQVA
jgi:hypothetical protein